jgi:hypothetical protein
VCVGDEKICIILTQEIPVLSQEYRLEGGGRRRQCGRFNITLTPTCFLIRSAIAWQVTPVVLSWYGQDRTFNDGNWGEHAASLVKLGETDLVPKFPYRHLVIDHCGGNYLLLRSVEYSYLKGQWPISRGDALEIDNKRVLRVLQKHCQGLGAAFQERKSEPLRQN